ncbi:MAG: hypothetical protein QOD83_497, partial [Solirubrobacteraceae bacterium]|nr:hypothetical protein [Solirubrobacteraceae bacterium]
MSVRRHLYEHFVIPAGERSLVGDEHFVVPSSPALSGDHEDFVGPDEAPERGWEVPRPGTPPG